MKSIVSVGILIVASTAALGQTPSSSLSPDAMHPIDVVGSDAMHSMEAVMPDYVRPSAKTRQTRFVKSIFDPVAIGRYAAVSGILTARNAPSEWGGKWPGFGRRVASNFGKSVINNTVRYGLDEALGVDSHYYVSGDRSFAAKTRNAVFSSVSSRNRQGKRVIGIPKIAGHLAANVIASETWYPKRYNYVHGLKGSAISIAVDAGINLFREFVWKK